VVQVFTGDIKEMWLRDSSAQVHPLVALVPRFPQLAPLIVGLLLQQADFLNDNKYGSAFRHDPPYTAQCVGRLLLP
jgi:meiotically up-regulated gene 157 (Mug157) protein